jgi:hypothetical protein
MRLAKSGSLTAWNFCWAIPEETARMVNAPFPKGNRYMPSGAPNFTMRALMLKTISEF